LSNVKYFYLFIKFLQFNVIDLLALRQSSPWPEDPVEHLRDYFGRHRDPMWDVVE
jgi:hypothetical protein